MNLRPHHVLCIQKFTGHGYSQDFTAHMSAVVSGLTDAPGTCITITQGCDDLCGKCPYNKNGNCVSSEKTAALDAAVLDFCDLTYKEEVPWAELAGTAREQILETDKFHEVCAPCQWYELCQNTEVRYGKHI